jgi:hypothetical protein
MIYIFLNLYFKAVRIEMSIKDSIKGIQDIFQSRDLKWLVAPKRMKLIILPIDTIIPIKWGLFLDKCFRNKLIWIVKVSELYFFLVLNFERVDLMDLFVRICLKI